MRVKAIISYNGSRFLGFQKQNSTSNTITTQIENSLKILNIHSPIIGSGRTDAGVHATAQVIHFDLPDFWTDLSKLKEILNNNLQDISFKHITKTNHDFHARFHAKRRMYRYIFKTKQPTIFERDFISFLPLKDIVKLNESLALFIGTHDFSNFLKNGSETKTNIRTIHKAYHIKHNNYHIIYFEADGFLRSQVRMMVDFAIKVANSNLTIKQQQEQLDTSHIHNRNIVPPTGLYLARVIY